MKKVLFVLVVVVSLLAGLFGYQAVSGSDIDQTPVVIEQVEYDHQIFLPDLSKECVNSECTEPIVCIIDDDSREFIPCEDEQ